MVGGGESIDFNGLVKIDELGREEVWWEPAWNKTWKIQAAPSPAIIHKPRKNRMLFKPGVEEVEPPTEFLLNPFPYLEGEIEEGRVLLLRGVVSTVAWATLGRYHKVFGSEEELILLHMQVDFVCPKVKDRLLGEFL